MEGNVLWQQRVARGEDRGSALWSIACSPDGAQLVLGVGSCVLQVEAVTGNILQTLAGHKAPVNAVAFAPDGAVFASGGADRHVIIWTAAGQVVRQCTHTGSVQCLTFNPRTRVLASGTTEEMTLLYEAEGSQSAVLHANRLESAGDSRSNFAPSGSSSSNSNNLSAAADAFVASVDLTNSTSDIKAVPSYSCPVECKRIRVSSRICCLSWDSDGRRIAAGHYNGMLVVRDEHGTKLWNCQTDGAVWAAAWFRCARDSSKSEKTEVKDMREERLALCTFEPKLWFVSPENEAVLTSVELPCDPLALSFAPECNFFLITSVDGSLTLWDVKGVCLQPIEFAGEPPSATAFCVMPTSQRVAFVSREGNLGMARLRLPVVHGLHREVYARRTELREVTVRSLLTDETTAIQFEELVQKVAVYQHLLAVQLQTCIVVAEALAGVSGPLDYSEVRRVPGRYECSLMLLVAQGVIFCKGHKLALHGFDGSVQRQWAFKASVRYVRVVGGPPGAEVLLAGLQNGVALYVYVHQEVSLPLLQHRAGLICVDVSIERGKLAVVDENKDLCVYDLPSKREAFTQPGCTAAAWNHAAEELLAVTTQTSLLVKTGSFTPYQQSCQGIVVGFVGSFAFCLYGQEMRRVEVNRSAAIQQLIRNGSLEIAYTVASLGASQEDLRQLGLEFLRRGDIRFARKAFQRQQDIAALTMLSLTETELRELHLPPQLHIYICTAHAFAFTREFDAAAEQWAAAGLPEKAAEMFADLRMWEKARRWSAVAASAQPKPKPEKASEEPSAGGKAKPGESSFKSPSFESAGEGFKMKKNDAKNSVFKKEMEKAAQLYLASGQLRRGCAILAKLGAVASLLHFVRRCRQPDAGSVNLHQKHYPQELLIDARETSEALRIAARAFEKGGHLGYAQEALHALGDTLESLKVLARAGRWEEALVYAEQDAQLFKQILIPWGRELLRRDQPENALAAFRRAGRDDLALRVHSALLNAAVSQQFYAQAAAYSWSLAKTFGSFCSLNMKGRTNSSCKGNTRPPRLYSCSVGPVALPLCVCQLLFCYFWKISEVYAVYFVLRRHALPAPPRAALTAPALLRACVFLWSHALAPQHADAASDSQKAAAGLSPPVASAFPGWRVRPWWREAQEMLQRPEVQRGLRLCGLHPLPRRVKGVRAALVLRLMAETALKLHDYQTAAAACRELRSLALRRPDQRATAELEVAIKAAWAAPENDASSNMSKISAGLYKTPCGLCGAAVPLLVPQAVPLGAELSCGRCGCPVLYEFGSFAPVVAIECCDDGSPTYLNNREKCNEEAVHAAIQARLLRLQAAANHPPAPCFIEFKPLALSAECLRRQPREKLWRGFAVCRGPCLDAASVLRLFRLPHAEIDSTLETALNGEELVNKEINSNALLRCARMLTACNDCGHLFVDPPAYKQLAPGTPCLCCSSKNMRTPLLPCSALQ